MSTPEKALSDLNADILVPKRTRTRLNRFQVQCGSCGDLFFVDQETAEKVRSAIAFDPAGNPFCCDDCEQEYDEEAMY
jgi:cell division protein FtsN